LIKSLLCGVSVKFSLFSERAFARASTPIASPVPVEALGHIYKGFGVSLDRGVAEYENPRNDLLDLGIGTYFPCSEQIVEPAVAAIRNGHTRYEQVDQLKDAIIAKYRDEHGVSIDRENVMLLGAARPGMALTMLTGIELGDRVIIPDPDYIGLTHMASAIGAQVIRAPMVRHEDGALSLDIGQIEDLAKDGVKAICLTNPNNPTGNVLSGAELRRLAAIAERQGAFVMVNEIYDKLVYSGQFTSFTTIGSLENSVVVGGTSKSYEMTGFGIGWLISSASNVARMEDLAFLTHQSKPDAPSQYAALAALTPPVRESSPQQSVKRLIANAERTVEALERFANCRCPMPQAGQFAFPHVGGDDVALARFLVNTVGLQVVPGSVWGQQGAGHLRIALANPVDHQLEGLDRLRDGIRRFRALE
jgi:aspartate/methionine/tyrosine aminotransferase